MNSVCQIVVTVGSLFFGIGGLLSAECTQPWVFRGIDVSRLAFSSTGKWLAAAGSKPPKSLKATYINKMTIGTGGLVRVWDVNSRKQVFQYSDDYWEATSAGFYPGSSLLAVGFQKKWRLVNQFKERLLPAPVIIWDVRTGKEKMRLLHDGNVGRRNCVQNLTFSPDGQWLATTSWGLLYVWDAKSGKRRFIRRELLYDTCFDLVFSPDSKMLACVTSLLYDGGKPLPKQTLVQMWEVGKDFKKKKGGFQVPNGLTRLAFSPDSKYLAAACRSDAKIRIFDLNRGKLACCFTAHSDTILCIAYEPDGRILYSGGGDDTWKSWKSSNGKLLQTHPSPLITNLAISPNGQWIATGSGYTDCAVRLWKLDKK